MKGLDCKTIVELCFIVRSCENMLNSKYNGKYEQDVNTRCESFCKEHNINITHGSAYKELRHKSYYYVDRNINDIIAKGVDTYTLHENHYISDKQIVTKLLK